MHVTQCSKIPQNLNSKIFEKLGIHFESLQNSVLCIEISSDDYFGFYNWFFKNKINLTSCYTMLIGEGLTTSFS